MSVYWKRLTTRSIFLFSLIALFCTGTTLQARADKTQGYAWGANYVGQLGNGSNVDKSFAQGIVALKNVTQVALGDSHSLALKSDGTVWAWGNNWTGQLGDGTNIGKNTPVPVSGLAGVVQVACGGFYSLALKSDGTVWTWGANNYGQLGDGTGGYGGSDFDKNTPVQVYGLTNVKQVVAGMDHSLAVKTDGSLWVWGRNYEGQFGDGTSGFLNDRNTPAQVANISGVLQAAAGGGHSLAVKLDGTVWAWGNNHTGQLGDGTTTDRSIPAQILGLSSVTQIIADSGVYTSGHCLALKSDGTVWAWGNNSHGNLGDGSGTRQLSPVQVPSLSGIQQVAGGYWHSLALKSDGTVWAWGGNPYGQLGDGTNSSKDTPIQVFGLGEVVQISAGGMHTLALGKVVVPTLSTTTSASKRTLPTGLTNVLEAKLTIKGTTTSVVGETLNFSIDGTRVGGAITDGAGVAQLPIALSFSAGAHIYKVEFTGNVLYSGSSSSPSLTLTAFTPAKGTVYTWGWNASGQLGSGYNYSTNIITQVKSLTGAVQIAGGRYSSLALKSNGTVWAWGNNKYGQIGDGTGGDRTDNFNKNTPTQVSSLSGVVQVASGFIHSLALKSDGTVWAWGWNGQGALGDGTTINKNTPVQVSSLSGVVQVAGGGLHSLALKSDGTVWAWGRNSEGQLGNGTTIGKNTPVQVSSLSGIIQIAGGGFHSLALKSDGTVWVWGNNGSGQLGDGTNDNKTTPTSILELTNVVQVAAGQYHTLAVKSDGTVWAWGNNWYGQLGDGANGDGTDIFNRNAPVQVYGLSGVVQVAGGAYHSIALKSDGTAWTWGNNQLGQLGDGSNDGKPTFVPVLFLTGQSNIATGDSHSLSIVATLRNTITSTSSLKATYGATTVLTGKLRLTGVVTLPVKPLVFSIEGVVVGTATTDASGTARLTLGSPIAPGVHSLDVAFAGDGNFNASGASGTIAVKAATTLSQKSVSGKAGSAVNLAATLTRTVGGALLVNKTVTFYVDGASVGTATTDANGVATLSYTITQAAGKYALKVTFDGDDGYLASSFTRASLVVK